MATDHSVNRTWKYLSFALIGILAAGGVSTAMPQASAHITTNVQHMLEHIYSFVDGIEAKTNNLPADPASNTVVDTRASQTSVNNLQTTATAIKTNTDTITPLKTHRGIIGLNDASYGSAPLFDILGRSNTWSNDQSEAIVYHGHISFNVFQGGSGTATVGCLLGDQDTSSGIAINTPILYLTASTPLPELQLEFTCQALSIASSDDMAILYAVQYTEVSNASEVEPTN